MKWYATLLLFGWRSSNDFEYLIYYKARENLNVQTYL
jgi:hypothetical protein